MLCYAETVSCAVPRCCVLCCVLLSCATCSYGIYSFADSYLPSTWQDYKKMVRAW